MAANEAGSILSRTFEKLVNLLVPRYAKPGIYHYINHRDFRGMRIHLRVEDDGSGVLMLNANRILYLNDSATEYLKMFLDNLDTRMILSKMHTRYRVDRRTILKDYNMLKRNIKSFVSATDVCPVRNIDEKLLRPMPRNLRAPLRMDLALTYKCNNDCIHCYNDKSRGKRELTKVQWKKVIDKLWSVGIPHIVFTGGEPTLKGYLPELIKHCQELGIVTGLITNGRKLADKEYVAELLESGLDYFQITIESHEPAIHNKMTCCNSWNDSVAGLKNAIATPIFCTTNTTLTSINKKGIADTVAFLKSLGITDFGCNGIIYSGRSESSEHGIPENELATLLEEVKIAAERLDMKFIWYTPTMYCRFDPVENGLGMKQCSAANLNMCIEPDGNVLPCQSYYKPVGNILTDRWTDIWNNRLCINLRGKKLAPKECRKCRKYIKCGGGCPLSLDRSVLQCPVSVGN